MDECGVKTSPECQIQSQGWVQARDNIMEVNLFAFNATRFRALKALRKKAEINDFEEILNACIKWILQFCHNLLIRLQRIFANKKGGGVYIRPGCPSISPTSPIFFLTSLLLSAQYQSHFMISLHMQRRYIESKSFKRCQKEQLIEIVWDAQVGITKVRFF